ncbi:MAG: hypothetical protein R2837_09675 [Aliarcobacter sp.]
MSHLKQDGQDLSGAKIRLVGFIIPETYDDKEHVVTKKRWDTNTLCGIFRSKS